MTIPLLSVENLRVSFKGDDGWTPVVHDIAFDIHAGQTVAIVGESGSGKSVTSLAIMRLLQKEYSRIEGSIRLNGKELTSLSEAEMQRIRGNEISMIFQEPMTSLNPSLTIGFQLAEVLMTHRGMGQKEAEAEAIRLMDRVRIPSAAARVKEYPHRLSGGMRQRVMIAMALTCKPRLLIADEPTTALDVTIQAQILDLIRELQQEEEMGVLFITHDMGVVAEISDRTVVMLHGRTVERGTTEQIFSSPEHPYTRALLSAVPKLGSMKDEPAPKKFEEIDRTTGLPISVTDNTPAKQPDLNAQPILEVRNLCKYFDIRSGLMRKINGRVHAVENVSFDIHQGETLALVGESGCGKSTTGRAIVRLTDVTDGEIRLDGKNIAHLDSSAFRQYRQSMQLIFQDPFASLNPSMRVGDAIAEPMLTHGTIEASEVRERVDKLLNQVGLDPSVRSRFPHEFSGGQRQRISIARALSLRPRLMVADEAVSALDVSIKAQVVNLMLDLQKEMGIAFLFISHDMAVVERISHRVAVMYLGEIVEIGTRSAIFSNPQHPYTKRLLSAVPVPDPSRRIRRPELKLTELKSPLRPADYVAPKRVMREVSQGHYVQEWGQEWEALG